MTSLATASAGRSDSPDPASHTANIYDFEDQGADDDDIDYRPAETESEDLEYFETGDDDDKGEGGDDNEAEEGHSDTEFHGILKPPVVTLYLLANVSCLRLDAHEGLQIEVSIDQSTDNLTQGSVGTVRVTPAAGATGPLNGLMRQVTAYS